MKKLHLVNWVLIFMVVQHTLITWKAHAYVIKVEISELPDDYENDGTGDKTSNNKGNGLPSKCNCKDPNPASPPSKDATGTSSMKPNNSKANSSKQRPPSSTSRLRKPRIQSTLPIEDEAVDWVEDGVPPENSKIKFYDKKKANNK